MNTYTTNFYSCKGGFKSELLSVPDEVVVDQEFASTRGALKILREGMKRKAASGYYEARLAIKRERLQ